jgi:hypothetical protein
VISISGGQDARIGPGALPSRGREIGVEEELLRELGNRYAQYRQAMSEPFDPVAVLTLTGNVFEAVNRILTSTERARALIPTKGERNRK